MGRYVIITSPLQDRLRALVETPEWSQRKVAEHLDTSPANVNNWCKGVTTPQMTPERVTGFASLFGCTPVEVLELAGYDLTSTSPTRGMGGYTTLRDLPVITPERALVAQT